MKYYMANETDASGHGHTDFTYYELSDSSTLEDAQDIYTEENPWVKYQECSRMRSAEIDEETYKAGLAFNRYVRVCRDNDYGEAFGGECGEHTYKDPKYMSYQLWEHHNMFPTRKWAEMFARPNKPVLIGYPKMFSVYKMDENRNLHFVYHYPSNGMDFRDDERLRKKFVPKWDK